MSPREEKPRSESASEESREDRKQDVVRSAAEWVTLSISTLLLLGVVGYLVREAMTPSPPFVSVEARPLMRQVKQEDGRYILPIEVRNKGNRALRDLRLEASYRGTDGSEETLDLEITYLGEASTETLYLYLERPPADLGFEVQPRSYALD